MNTPQDRSPRKASSIQSESGWKPLNEHRSEIDARVVAWERKHQTESPPDLKSMYVAVRLILDTKYTEVPKSQFKPMMSGDGYVFPDIECLDESFWSRIESVAKSTEDCRLRSHLSDLCWTLNNQSHMVDYAIEGYRQTYNSIETFTSTPSHRIDQLIALYRALELAKGSGRKSEHTSITHDILSIMSDSVSVDSLQLNGWNLDLFRMAHIRLTHFEISQRQNIYEYVTVLKNSGIGNEHLAYNALEIHRDFAQSLGRQSDLVLTKEQMVDYWLEIAGQDDPTSLGASDRIRQAIVLIRELPKSHPLKARVAELELERQRLLKDETEYSTFVHEMELDAKFIQDFLGAVKLPDGKEVLALPCFLISSAPTKESLRVQLEEHKQVAPLLHSISHRPVWNDGVVETVLASEEEQDAYFKTQNLIGFARILSVYLVGLSVHESIGFESNSVVNVLRESELIDRRRQETLEASVDAYFSKKYRLFASLLAMEFEPALRHLFSLLGWNYLVSDQNGAQNTMQLGTMLADKRLPNVVPEQWILLSRAILLDDGGTKLRHRVAHGRDISEISNREFATLLLSLYLWIANLTTVESKEASENSVKR